MGTVTPTQQPPQPTPATVSKDDVTHYGREFQQQFPSIAKIPCVEDLIQDMQTGIATWRWTAMEYEKRYNAVCAELARVTALREAFEHLDQYGWVTLFDSLLGDIQELAGRINLVGVDDRTTAARISELCDAWWSGAYVAQASERAAGSGEGDDKRTPPSLSKRPFDVDEAPGHG